MTASEARSPARVPGRDLVAYFIKLGVTGRIGLWIKANSVTSFDELTVTPGRRR